ncbi:CHC2 zinc finger domain-containing protein [Thermodesulfobacteriota bacterium]
MTKRRFTNHELYALRNDIPIDALIEKALYIPSRIADGYFRFLCPLCKEFNTAVNPETNLARCFRCQENFNTIDLVITTRKLDFVESVRFLKDYHKSAPVRQNDNYRKATTGSDAHDGSQMKCPDRSESSNNMVHIGHILDRMVPSKHERIPPGCNRPAQQNMVNDRILRLEQRVDRLFHQIENILKAIHIDNPSHQ